MTNYSSISSTNPAIILNGEKMRAGLAISLLCSNPPQLIILDEPTNHLNLKSICAVEQALRAYQGAILAVSHDEMFLENIGVKQNVLVGQ